MVIIVGACAFVFCILLLNEWLWRKQIIKGELARKFMHICAGTFSAFGPFLMSWHQLRIVMLMSIFFIILMRIFHIFKSIYDIKRRSWGDLIGPITIWLLAVIETQKWVFVAAVLHIALADGLAAVIGCKYGKKNSYKVLWGKKSIVGTLTFWVVSFSILAWVLILSPPEFSGFTLTTLLWLPIMGALVENISPFGSDNFFVPILIVIVLSPLQFVY